MKPNNYVCRFRYLKSVIPSAHDKWVFFVEFFIDPYEFASLSDFVPVLGHADLDWTKNHEELSFTEPELGRIREVRVEESLELGGPVNTRFTPIGVWVNKGGAWGFPGIS